MLVNGECSVYPVRPITCRTHFVYSNPQSCRPSSDPEYTAIDPLGLTSVVTVTNPFAQKIKDRIENAGMDFSHSMMLLPQWLAIKMGWEFAISL
jgi:Fe-S-cluster containining protein